MFVRSQLSRMPGEERKFKRRRIVAFISCSRRERDAAASQAVTGTGVPAIGVDVDSASGVEVGAGSGVAEGTSALVPVGDGSEAAVGVGDSASVGDKIDIAVSIGELGVDVAGRDVCSVTGVEVGSEAMAAAGGDAVDSGGRDCGIGIRSRTKKRINRMIATMDLKTSYPGAPLYASIGPLSSFVLFVLQILLPAPGSSPALRRTVCTGSPVSPPIG